VGDRGLRNRAVWAGGQTAPAPGYATPFPLGSPSPNTVLNVVFQGILEAWRLNRTLGAIAARHFDPDPVAREKDLGG
jgi:hypothetical protein